MFILVVGNPVEGVEFYGPFPSNDSALTWAERNLGDHAWWIAPLQPVLTPDEG